jgi:hypothetical protein
MIKYLKHNQIDKTKWDKALVNAPFPYLCSWYLDIVSPKWDALVLGNYDIIMPLPLKKKLTIKYLAQPYFTQQLGIYSQNNISVDIIESFLNECKKHFNYIEISLNETNTDYIIKEKTHKQINVVLPLAKEYEELSKNFAKNTQRQVKKAANLNLLVQDTDKFKEVINLFINNRGKTLSNLKKRHYELFEKLINQCKKFAKVETKITVDSSGNILSGIILLFWNNRIINLFSASGEEGKNCGAMHFLFAEIIKKYSSSEYVLDFEGSNNVNLARFYKSFGSKEIVYLRFKNNTLPFYIKWVKK